MANRVAQRQILSVIIWVASMFLVHLLLNAMEGNEKEENEEREIIERSMEERFRDRANLFLIFIGGMPRSGTTLMRTMLDAHQDIRCGQETHVIPHVLDFRRQRLRSPANMKRLMEAGVHPDALDNAVTQFLLEIIIGHGPPAKYLCNKDPYTQYEVEYLHKLFPNAKFIFMIRDGRAFAHSVITRGVQISGYDLTSYRKVLAKWNDEIRIMQEACKTLGPELCCPVYYEQLVLQPVVNTKRIFDFLGIPWNERVLHHEKHINETKLSTFEFSTDQVQKPLYLDALKSWFGKIPKDVERDMAKIAPMLSMLGYDPFDPTPYYGDPDEFVLSMMTEEEKRAVVKRTSQNQQMNQWALFPEK